MPIRRGEWVFLRSSEPCWHQYRGCFLGPGRRWLTGHGVLRDAYKVPVVRRALQMAPGSRALGLLDGLTEKGEALALTSKGPRNRLRGGASRCEPDESSFGVYIFLPD